MSELTHDLTKDAAELMRRADAGDAKSQYMFALYLLRESDYSYRKDLSLSEVQRAIRYLQLSAVQGYDNGIAADDLGAIYYDGKVVPKDYKKAKLWFTTALLKGIPTAAYKLGECAYNGYGGEVDYEKAAEYYLQAAPGFIDALVRLGDMYLRGDYFPRDINFAKKIYTYVLNDEKKLHKMYGFYSDAYEMVRNRLDDLERKRHSQHLSAVDETDEQVKIRSGILEILDKHFWSMKR